ncbi:hypothetical protein L596_009392 [Steinernema carpocapsae]|uniref:Uncharacterized protein n=1 Tax=Steinernema carpocapsae TaxID=34508 RepID=A0A4U5PFR3_STECR|nr:hypothetical protein L596_009392 [Steinernema carpocapsae]
MADPTRPPPQLIRHNPHGHRFMSDVGYNEVEESSLSMAFVALLFYIYQIVTGFILYFLMDKKSNIFEAIIDHSFFVFTLRKL